MTIKILEIHMQKHKSRHRPYTFYKINSTCIIILKIQKYITFLEDNIGEKSRWPQIWQWGF